MNLVIGSAVKLSDDLTPSERSRLAKQFSQALSEAAPPARPYTSPFVDRLICNGEAMEEETLP